MAKLNNLATFIEVVKRGGFASAARSLGLPRSTVSLRVKSLEDQLDTRLLRRSTRAISLTDDGRALFDRIEEPFSILDQALDQISDGRDTLRGTIRLTAPADFPYAPLAEAMTSFRRIHPDVRFDVKLTNDVLDMIEENIDLAIRIGALDDSRMVARLIAPNRRVLCASPDYLARRGAPQMPADLADHDCLLLVGSGGRQDVWRLGTPGGGEVAVRVHGRFESNFGEVLRDASLAGQGIVVHSLWHVADDLRAGRLKVVLPDFPLATTSISAVMPQRRLVPPRVRAFVDFLSEAFGEHPPWERGLAT